MATPARRRRAVSRQPATRRRSARKRRNEAIGIAAVLAGFVVISVVKWLAAHQAIAGLLAASALSVCLYLGGRRAFGWRRAYLGRRTAPTTLAGYLAASPDRFEQQTAALCRRDGCGNVTVVGGAGDLAADVLATTPDGRRILIQCKRYKPGNLVGSDHVQRVNGTYRDIHRCQIAAIVTTSGYTRDATALARRVGIRLYGGDELETWARGGRPPWR